LKLDLRRPSKAESLEATSAVLEPANVQSSAQRHHEETCRPKTGHEAELGLGVSIYAFHRQ